MDLTASPVGGLVAHRRVVVCAGSGGVGKTTTSAALAVAASQAGRRAVVLTIDPARRLADALGVEGGLGAEPTLLDEPPGGGQLWAMMLDPKATFDDLVAAQAATPEQARRILENRFYGNMSGALSGTQEYMAAEQLLALATDDRFDVVVVDTPPSRHALDFIDAPARLVRLLDNRVYRFLTSPSRGAGRVVNVAARTFLRGVGKVVGTEVIDDVVAFFAAFDGLEDGFRERARQVTSLLAGDDSAFVLIASPRPDTVVEAVTLARRLADRDITVDVATVNLLHPDPFATITADDRAVLDATTDPALAARWQAARELSVVAARERDAIQPLVAAITPAPVVGMPLLDEDVHDADTLTTFAAHLLAPSADP